MSSLVYVVGCRPNFVKTAPVLHAMRARAPHLRHVLVHTGQHYDAELWQVFVDELDLLQPDYLLGVGSGPHGAQTARALERLEEVLQEERPAAVVVPGDVNSTLAGALAAVKLGIPIAHVEAGLRSFDWSMPEEVNRTLVDRMATWCFTHSADAGANLRNEGVPDERIHFVGNTMIDSLVRLRPRIASSQVLARIGLEPRGYVLVTLHRPELVDGPLLEVALAGLERLARDVPVVFPVHPRTRARIGDAWAPAGVAIVDPVGYVDFLALEAGAAAVVTDSGGVQEETTFLRVPCFTLRRTTERPVTVTLGTNRLLGLDLDAIARVPRLVEELPLPLAPPPLWDGRAGERIADVVLAALAEGTAPCAESAAP